MSSASEHLRVQTGLQLDEIRKKTEALAIRLTVSVENTAGTYVPIPGQQIDLLFDASEDVLGLLDALQEWLPAWWAYRAKEHF